MIAINHNDLWRTTWMIPTSLEKDDSVQPVSRWWCEHKWNEAKMKNLIEHKIFATRDEEGEVWGESAHVESLLHP
jgi:hypothetical protein